MTDDLSQINGVGPVTVEKLNSRGITSFAQIAELTDDQVLQLNEELDLRDSIINHDWRKQAAEFAGNPTDPTPQPPVQQAPKAKGKMIPVRIKRDFWDGNGERHRKGTVIEVPVEEALDGIEAGALSRVKD